ncbi:MAG TPA: hypothetical protein VGX78_03725 [Pirellulales bacterium]|jgi:hypothetical protein|nr:hypothetical protein [Pirellulales bacterium]
MVSLIKCSRCGSTLDPTRVGEGQPLACEFCEEVNRTPVTVPGVKGAVYELLDSALAEMPPPPPPPPPKRNPWPLIAAAALGLAVFGVAVLLLVNAIREPGRTSGPLTSSLESAAKKEASVPSPPDESVANSDWTPDRAIVERLGLPAVRFGQWIWRLPEGFEPTHAAAGMQIYRGELEAWAWSAGAEGEEMLAAFHLDSFEMKRLHDPTKTRIDESKLQAGLVDRLKHALQPACNLRELEFTPREPGRLGRREFQRLDFLGIAANDSKVYGELLFSRHERSLLVLLTISPFPPGHERHAELLAAALTLD